MTTAAWRFRFVWWWPAFWQLRRWAPQGVARFTRPVRLILRRYRWLVLPYLVAVVASVLVAALVHPWFDHSSVTAAPTWLQVIAHAFLLQELLGEGALSAGFWYMAIDLQLFAVCVLVFSFARTLAKRWPGLPSRAGVWMVGVLALLSLFFFNRQPGLDITALYFFASYVLGCRRPQRALCDASTSLEMPFSGKSVGIGAHHAKRAFKPVVEHCF